MGQSHNIPGQLIDELLATRGWSKRVLAIVLGIDESLLSKIIAGKRDVDAELALALGEVFEVEPEEFLKLQQQYDLARARLIVKKDPKRSSRARLFGGMPILDMVRRGWLDVSEEDIRDVAKVEAAVLKFFETQTVDEVTAPAHAAKKTDVGKDTTMIQTAWLHRVRQIASEMLVPKFTVSAAKAAIATLQNFRLSAEEARHVPRTLMEAGIRFLLVEALPGAKIDGVCTWFDDGPVVALSMRHDRIDNFWFVLRHELEHVLSGDGKTVAVVDVDVERAEEELPPEEKLANDAAAEFCIAQKTLLGFIARKSPYFSERDIIGFARTNQVHPGIVAGQLQNRTKRYDRFRAHQVKIRSIVAPSAIVDGWGDVAPVG